LRTRRAATCYYIKDLENLIHNALPGWPSSDLGLVGVDGFPVQVTTTGINIHLLNLEPSLALPEEANDPEEEDDRDGKEVGEESLGIVELISAWWSDGVVELVSQESVSL
jgi:hypothetical protein